ncbi:MAG: histidine triad nucleotide-binding protein [Patescibacteria group bacterium]|nr:histidine triad nucleotide-binding protein [Patescibacteria group bacterium]
MKNCIFCKIVQGEISSEFIYESDTVIAFNDVNPIAPVHILIIPRVHIDSMNDINSDNSIIIADMFMTAVEIAKDKGIEKDGYKLLIRTGKNGGQEVPHIHLHLIGGAPLHEDIHPL